jgi:hypothetical protein
MESGGKQLSIVIYMYYIRLTVPSSECGPATVAVALSKKVNVFSDAWLDVYLPKRMARSLVEGKINVLFNDDPCIS